MKKLSKNKGRNSKTAASAQIPKFLTKTFEILEVRGLIFSLFDYN
mgnify:CR=1 FL=1